MSIFVAPFYHEGCHISKISMDEMRARLDILILFIDKAVFVVPLLRAARQIFDKFRIAPPHHAGRPEIHSKNERRAARGAVPSETSMCVN